MSSQELKYKNYLPEAERLLDIIDEKKVKKQEDYLFIQSMKARVRVSAFVNEKQIHWMRDIKDRQLEED